LFIHLRKTIYINFILILLLFSSCSSVNTPTGPKPPALGKMNEIVVIADEDLWEGIVGDSFKYYFGSAYPIMPSPEPMFDIRHYTPQELNGEPLRRELRTYVILSDLEDKSSATAAMIEQDLGKEKFRKAFKESDFTTSVGKNKWADGQLLFYLFGVGHESLFSTISRSFKTIASRVNDHDKGQLHSMTYSGSQVTGFNETLASKFGIKLGIPAKFKMAVEEGNMIWLRKDDGEFALNLVFDKKTYENQDQLSTDALKDWIHEFGTNWVTTSTEGSVMVINEKDLPLFEYNQSIKGAFTNEIRGVWEMTLDFTGGPFFAYSILNEKANEVIYIYAFVMAPGKPKRDKMQQLEHIVHSIEWM